MSGPDPERHPAWALHVLTEVLSSLSAADGRSVERAAERVAEALDAEVVLALRDGQVVASAGLTADDRAALVDSAVEQPSSLEFPIGPTGSGRIDLCWSPLEGDDVLVVGRFGGSFDLEERSLLRSIGRALALNLRVLDALDAERSARRELDDALDVVTHRATHDPLTGLPGRELLLERLDRRLLEAEPARRHQVFVLFIDVDRFKQVNDVHGHAVGDLYLRAIAVRLNDFAAPDEICARLAGDEFVLMTVRPSLEAARQVADSLLAELVAPVDLDGHVLVPSVSVGLAQGTPGYRAEALIDDADLAMYRAKQEGRGRVVVFDPALRLETERRAQVEADLRHAVRSVGGLVPYYQPVVNMVTGGVVGFEALVRWVHPERGLVPPDEFVPVAEETGLIVEIDSRMLRAACAQVAEWRRRPGWEHLTVSVNSSARSFADPGLPARVAEALELSGLPPSALLLELTETVLMDESRSGEQMRELVDLGIRLAVDDFGTGFSSLRYLREFPVAVLKVDRSFVDALEGTGDVIVRTVVGLAESLGLAVTAEGVETEQQRERLVELGCGYAQGYLFGRPADADAATSALLGSVEVSSPGADRDGSVGAPSSSR